MQYTCSMSGNVILLLRPAETRSPPDARSFLDFFLLRPTRLVIAYLPHTTYQMPYLRVMLINPKQSNYSLYLAEEQQKKQKTRNLGRNITRYVNFITQ